MLLLVIFSFIAGIVTILSPCILPVLPIVLSASLTGGKKRPIGIATGFILSFSFFTLFLTSIVRATGLSANFLRDFSVVVIFLFGASLLLPKFQYIIEKFFTKFLSRFSKNSKHGTNFWSGIILGLSIGLVWTPCVGPILASVITLAATNSVNSGAILITFAYAFGTAIPMLAITFGGRSLLQKVPWLLKNSENIQKAFGIVMILVAVGIFFNLDRKFQTFVLTTFPQYGVGLTRIENNNIVKNALKNLKQDSGVNILQNKISLIGQSMYPKAPDFIVGGQWFNSNPLTIKELRGKVVLVDFFTYTCINCIRTLPYVKSWYTKYRDKGFVVVGVHTPEFEFEKNAQNVSMALKDFGIKYPVMQDNNYATWNAYNNSYWPADYLIDKNGRIRDEHFGEGGYNQTESMIQKLLKETGVKVDEKIQNPTYAINALTPESYLGYNRLNNLDSIEAVANDTFSNYSMPSNLPINQLAFSGSWKVGAQKAIPSKGAVLEFHFNAKNVYLVLNPKGTSSKFKVLLDGKVVDLSNAGSDVKDGIVNITNDRLYSLIKLQKGGDHILKLEFLDSNSELFAFTFG